MSSSASDVVPFTQARANLSKRADQAKAGAEKIDHQEHSPASAGIAWRTRRNPPPALVRVCRVVAGIRLTRNDGARHRGG